MVFVVCQISPFPLLTLGCPLPLLLELDLAVLKQLLDFEVCRMYQHPYLHESGLR